MRWPRLDWSNLLLFWIVQENKRLVLSVRLDSHVGSEKLARELGLVF